LELTQSVKKDKVIPIYPFGFMMTNENENNLLRDNLKNLLQEKLWLLEARFKQKRLATPYKILTDSESRILATLKGEALTVSEVARRLNISRQGVHKTVAKLVELNLLKLEIVRGNARDKQIEFTEEGEAMKATSRQVFMDLEQEIEATIGKDDLRLLKSLLRKDW
jgi:DNA-binding MarR family transcriptional regulator